MMYFLIEIVVELAHIRELMHGTVDILVGWDGIVLDLFCKELVGVLQVLDCLISGLE